MKESYEISYWLRISVEPEKEEEKLLDLLKNFSGEIIKKTTPRKKQLAYYIRPRGEASQSARQTLGFFGSIYFLAETEVIAMIKNELKLHKGILRYIIVKNKIEREQENETAITGADKTTENSNVNSPIFINL
jgi:ribosomal protein S6